MIFSFGIDTFLGVTRQVTEDFSGVPLPFAGFLIGVAAEAVGTASLVRDEAVAEGSGDQRRDPLLACQSLVAQLPARCSLGLKNFQHFFFPFFLNCFLKGALFYIFD